MPELVWKAFIEFEIANGENLRVKQLYEELLQSSNHVKVWISYGCWLFGVNKKEREAARAVFKRGYQSLREQSLNEERVLLLEAWLRTDKRNKQEIEALMPKKVKRRKQIGAEVAEEDAGWEEYYDYVFPEDNNDSSQAKGLKILEMAHKWK